MDFIIKACRQLSSGNYVILCELPDNPSTPWATWITPTPDGSVRLRGQYFYPGEENFAREDYETRLY